MYAFCGVSNVFTAYVLCVHGVYSCAWCGRMVYTFGDMCYVICACGLCDCVVSCVYCRFYVICMCVRSSVFCRMCVAVVMRVDGVCALCFLLCCVWSMCSRALQEPPTVVLLCWVCLLHGFAWMVAALCMLYVHAA